MILPIIYPQATILALSFKFLGAIIQEIEKESSGYDRDKVYECLVSE
jgi:hypothetical protein